MWVKKGGRDNREVDMVRDRTLNTLTSGLNITINQLFSPPSHLLSLSLCVPICKMRGLEQLSPEHLPAPALGLTSANSH